MRAQTMPGNGSNVGLGREFTTLGGLCLKISPKARDLGCSSTSEPLLRALRASRPCPWVRSL